MCVPLLYKGFITLLLSISALIITLLRKQQMKKCELVIGIIFVIICSLISCKEFYHAINPALQEASVTLVSNYRPRYRIGNEYTFIDKTGAKFSLYMDPLTLRNYIKKNGELVIGDNYKIIYEENEEQIIEIKDNTK